VEHRVRRGTTRRYSRSWGTCRPRQARRDKGQFIVGSILHSFWQNSILCNAMLDHCISLTTVGVVTANVKAVLGKVPLITGMGDKLSAKIVAVLQTLGLLATL
jgi:hypothetical protein